MMRSQLTNQFTCNHYEKKYSLYHHSRGRSGLCRQRVRATQLVGLRHERQSCQRQCRRRRRHRQRTVSSTVGAGQQLIFVSQNFNPINLSAPNTVATVNFNLSVSGGLTGANAFGNPRVFGVGLFNTAGTA